jgi:hypothetical protein
MSISGGGAGGGGPPPRPPGPLGTLALLGVLALGLAGSGSGPRPDQMSLSGYGSSGVAGRAASSAPKVTTNGTFKISGTVAGLYPGLTKSLVLTVTNPQGFAIVVTSLVTKDKAASVSCAASYLAVGAFSGHLSVPAHGSAKTSVHATLSAGTPNACKGKTFPLVYSGAAREG